MPDLTLPLAEIKKRLSEIVDGVEQKLGCHPLRVGMGHPRGFQVSTPGFLTHDRNLLDERATITPIV
jgi:hypothetical protein